MTVLSSDLQQWAALAGFTAGSDPRGRIIFSDNGGEVRLFVGRADDGWFTVSRSDRLGPEEVRLAARDLDTIEKYFYGEFGADVRYARRLRTAIVPTEERELPDGFRLGLSAFDGIECATLFDRAGQAVAVDTGGLSPARLRLAELAVYLSASVEEIKASCLAVDGKPLLTVL